MPACVCIPGQVDEMDGGSGIPLAHSRAALALHDWSEPGSGPLWLVAACTTPVGRVGMSPRLHPLPKGHRGKPGSTLCAAGQHPDLP